jgi:hypothetical protein
MVLGRHPANTDLDDVDYSTTPPTYIGLKQGDYRLPSLICPEALSLLRAHMGADAIKQVCSAYPLLSTAMLGHACLAVTIVRCAHCWGRHDGSVPADRPAVGRPAASLQRVMGAGFPICILTQSSPLVHLLVA